MVMHGKGCFKSLVCAQVLGYLIFKCLEYMNKHKSSIYIHELEDNFKTKNLTCDLIIGNVVLDGGWKKLNNQLSFR